MSISSLSIKIQSDEKSMPIEIEQASFNVEAICNAAIFDMSAEELAETTPELLHSFSQYNEQQLMELFKSHILQHLYTSTEISKIEKTVKQLYSISLRNSRYNQITKELEESICTYLSLTKVKQVKELVNRAQLLSIQQLPDTAKKIQAHRAVLFNLMQEINRFKNLYFYLDLPNREKIENLYTHTSGFEENPFPRCSRYFPILCRNLEKFQTEHHRLSQIQKSIQSQISQLSQKATQIPFSPALLSAEREHFYQNHAETFWKVGSCLLKKALKTTFKQKQTNHNYLPSPLWESIYRASKLPDCQSFTFKAFCQNPTDEVPEQYLNEVWIRYLNRPFVVDIGDTMRLILKKFPAPLIESLQSHLKISQNREQTILETLEKFLEHRIQDQVNLMQLKSWLDAARTQFL